jgi:hypothetical protein
MVSVTASPSLQPPLNVQQQALGPDAPATAQGASTAAPVRPTPGSLSQATGTTSAVPVQAPSVQTISTDQVWMMVDHFQEARIQLEEARLHLEDEKANDRPLDRDEQARMDKEQAKMESMQGLASRVAAGYFTAKVEALTKARDNLLHALPREERALQIEFDKAKATAEEAQRLYEYASGTPQGNAAFSKNVYDAAKHDLADAQGERDRALALKGPESVKAVEVAMKKIGVAQVALTVASDRYDRDLGSVTKSNADTAKKILETLRSDDAAAAAAADRDTAAVNRDADIAAAAAHEAAAAAAAAAAKSP